MAEALDLGGSEWRWIPDEGREGRAWQLVDPIGLGLGDVVTYVGEARYYSFDYATGKEVEYASMREAAVGLLERVLEAEMGERDAVLADRAAREALEDVVSTDGALESE